MVAPARQFASESASDAGKDRYDSVDLDGMQVGATLRVPVYEDRPDNSLILLLASGTTFTSSLLARLKLRGITSVRVRHDELIRLTGGRRGSSQNGTASSNRRWQPSPDSFLHTVARPGAIAYDSANQQELIALFNSSATEIESLYARMFDGPIGDAAPMAAVSSESLVRIAADLDLFIALGLTPVTDNYPSRHSLQAAMLAMSIGTLLGLKQDELIELGIGCLIHDAGMLKLTPEIVNIRRPLSKVEFLEITRHPTITFDALQRVSEVPSSARLVAYQMHERLDGSGYPRHRTGNQIHHLAKIAAVADVFVALLSPRPHRPGLLPYHAMEQILHGTRTGLYDPAVVRALLHAVSLFPIGSYVEISDGRVGRVLRSNHESYAAPIIELAERRSSRAPTQLIDLRQHSDLKIVRAVPDASIQTDVDRELIGSPSARR